MYQINKTAYGYELIFSGFIDEAEMSAWVKDSKTKLATQSGSFSVFVDMRSLKPLSPQAKLEMEEGQKLFKQKGMERSVVVLNDALLTLQFKRIAKETGIYQWERYVDASKNADWESKALAWVKKGTDPDL